MLNAIDYHISLKLQIADIPFDALIAAAIRKADDINLEKLRNSYPQIVEGLQKRYHEPSGILPEEITETESCYILSNQAIAIANSYFRRIYYD